MANKYAKLETSEVSIINKNQRSYGSMDPPVGFAPSTSSQTSSAEFYQLCEKITTHLFTINKGASDLERYLKQVGSSADSQALRDRITQSNHGSGAAVQETTELLRRLQPQIRKDKERRIRAEKLHNEFQSAATRFSEVQKKTVDMLRTACLPADMVAMEQNASAAASDNDALAKSEKQKLKQMQALQEVEFETAMVKEREQRVLALESDIIDINEIMKDLSSMVSEQGEIIDSIDKNVEEAHDHIEEGCEELVKAARYQNKSRRRLFILVSIFIIVLGIIAIILTIHFTKK